MLISQGASYNKIHDDLKQFGGCIGMADMRGFPYNIIAVDIPMAKGVGNNLYSIAG